MQMSSTAPAFINLSWSGRSQAIQKGFPLELQSIADRRNFSAHNKHSIETISNR